MKPQTQRPFFARKTLLATALAAITVPSYAQNLVLEEVIVTATKRASTIQDISGTVNVVTGDSMEKFATFGFKDIEDQTAGLTLSTPNARNASIAMRGISLDPEAGASAVVTVFWNDQVIRPDVAFSQIFDMERIEILRGPQGTLQGRTSPGGSINMVTRKADLNEATGSVELTVADNDGLNTQVAYGAPIVDGVFAMRIAAVYGENNANDVKNIATGDDSEAEAISARLSAVWQITDNLSSQLVWQYFDREIDDPKGMEGTDLLGERPTLKATDRIALGKSTDFGNMEYDLINLQFNWEIGDNMDFVSVTGWVDADKSSGTETDRANYVAIEESITWQTTNTITESLSQEFRLSSTDNEFWDWMIGAFYLDQDTATDFSSNRSISGGISFNSFGDIPVERDELGLFTHNTFYITDLMKLEFGLRYADYEFFRQADVFYGGLNHVPTFLEPFLPLIEAGLAATFPIEGISEEFQTDEEDAITGSLTLNYDWTDNTTVYGAYNRGYRPSGISINPTPAIRWLPNGEEDVLHDEETSDAIEVGFKGRYMDGRASLNGALYYQQFDGYLGFVRGVQVVDDTGALQDLTGGLIYNGDATIWGVEFEGQILFTERWSAGGALAYAKGEWDDGAEAPCNEREPGEALGYCDIGGDNLGGEPEFSLSLNSEYFIPFESTEWYLRGLYKYTDERDNTEASAGISSRATFEDYHIFNLYTGLRSSDYRWDVSVWVKNLLDSDEVIFEQGSDQYDIAATGGSYTQPNVQEERTIGLTARYNF